MEKILVTGGAGFIGSHLCDELLSKGYDVVAVDNFFRGKEENLPKHDNFMFYKCDIAKDKYFTDIVIKEKPDTVFHYAAINGTKYFYDIPYELLDENIEITKKVLRMCRHPSIKKIIYASSSEIYGTPKVLPTSETEMISLNTLADRDSYAMSKAVGEFYVRLFAETFHKEFLIYRIFNSYGSRMDSSEYGQVIPEFIRKVKSPKQFTIIGSGEVSRSFCHVKDHVRLAVRLAETQRNDIFNVGNDNETSINNLARMIHKIAKRKFKPEYLEPRPYDHPRRCPDIRKMKSAIDDYPKIKLKDGLEEMLN